MGLPIPPPEIQFIDANGHPYAGGTLETYVPGTTTAKDTWQDEGETILNSNPIVLDAAGRALVWGDGDYRFIVRDNTGQLVYDQVTSVVDLSTFATMAEVNAAVQAETNRATAAENALGGRITAEVNRAEAAENTLTTNLNSEIARAEAAEANLQSEITALGTSTQLIQMGYGNTSSGGTGSVTFTTHYGTYAPVVVATVEGGTFTDAWLSVVPSTTGFSIWAAQPIGGSLSGLAVGFYWIAIGNP